MTLRKFEILEMIAKGGMAEVYRAQAAGPEGFAKELCVKKILPHLTEDEKFVSMFVNEAKLAASLNFANIVSVHDLCVSATDEYFIVMEYIHGKDLADIIRAAQLGGHDIPPQVVGYIGREVCRGLQYAHSKKDKNGAPLNIIHRDISPQNILCSFMGEVKITDFGIAKASTNSNQTAVGILKGKYGYMSPEQAHGKELDPRSDVFNLGIVLYELLVQERCFAGASDYSTLNLMREASVTPPRTIKGDIPVQLEKIVLKALAREPSKRFQTAREMEMALEDFDRQSHASDLEDLLRKIFSSKQSQKIDRTTGVLNLESVVAPIPEKLASEKNPPAEHRVEETPSPMEVQPTPVDSEKGAPDEEPQNASQAKASAKESKKQKKAERAANKVPVGRKHLKPNWTALNKISPKRNQKSLVLTLILILCGTAIGFLIGLRETSTDNYAAAVRVLESERLDLTKDSAGLVAARVESSPKGAAISINGKPTNLKTPAILRNLKPESVQRLQLSLSDYASDRANFKVQSTALTRINKSLKLSRPNLEIETEPKGATIMLGHRNLGESPVGAKVSRGTHLVTIKKTGYLTVKKKVIVKEEKVVKQSLRLISDKEAAQLRVTSDLPARILVDGDKKGYTNDDQPIFIAPDVAHEITIESLSGTRSTTLNVQLPPKTSKNIYTQLAQNSRTSKP
ncbi:MAG: serine/threonine-protein kinase [Myxococcota bacterium]|nr:serine/threonine-protein kinase [Myxococcota bacterium]